MNVNLPERLQHFVETQIQAGRFASEDEAITEAVRLLAESQQAEPENGRPAQGSGEPAWQRIVNAMRQVPDEEFDRLPADGSEQLDHYIYGTPKRSRS